MKLPVLIPAVLISASLTGCATTKGLEVSTEDSKECAEVGCTPWSERQIEALAKHFYGLGVKAGIQRQKGSI
ncbi:hypothetical protein J2W88_003908 [Acidovorax delafieldii]|uniref:Lipoprotein n=1 Tax=Acidovorax delafieldii TaxID=47920 RepID=A0AAJ2BV52_ACIDE|nr:hypothetical protein [Acidovorax delafieldii]MDR6768604.1 hypothetical protein [Acidovorax delafieldii]MDR6837319.1 hypothetical protein [Acidovorax delafieldii]MDR7366810.1 hypothetical protein [Acidovorax delafieldii]